MTVKEKFINDLIDEMNDINENRVREDKHPLNVCYMVSVLDQQLDECSEFIQDITKHNYYLNGYTEDNTGGYTNGSFEILIEKSEEEKESGYMVDAYYDYYYQIEFLYDTRDWGYCQCEPTDEGYNEKHKCCGCGCDWTAPAFKINKISFLSYRQWSGYARDYWKYEEDYKVKQKDRIKNVEEYNKEQQRKYLEKQLEEIHNKLDELS